MAPCGLPIGVGRAATRSVAALPAFVPLEAPRALARFWPCGLLFGRGPAATCPVAALCVPPWRGPADSPSFCAMWSLARLLPSGLRSGWGYCSDLAGSLPVGAPLHLVGAPSCWRPLGWRSLGPPPAGPRGSVWGPVGSLSPWAVRPPAWLRPRLLPSWPGLRLLLFCSRPAGPHPVGALQASARCGSSLSCPFVALRPPAWPPPGGLLLWLGLCALRSGLGLGSPYPVGGLLPSV